MAGHIKRISRISGGNRFNSQSRNHRPIDTELHTIGNDGIVIPCIIGLDSLENWGQIENEKEFILPASVKERLLDWGCHDII
jgi:hypothetical protein